MSDEEGTPEGEATPSDPVLVNGKWLVVDGCKVAEVVDPDTIAFLDRCRLRSDRRGRQVVRVTLAELARVLRGSEGSPDPEGRPPNA